MSYRLRGMGTAPIFAPGGLICASDEQLTPIKAFVASPDESDYLAGGNWHCVKKSVMAEQSGFTFSAGLKAWTNPAYAAVAALTSWPHFADAPGYAAGLLMPLVAIGYLLWPKGNGSSRRYGR